MSNKPIFVTGHKNPDTDSFCSAIGYAYFKTQKGFEAEPICAGAPNKETSFALKYFNVPVPPIVKDFYIKVSEVMEAVPALEASDDINKIAAWRKQYNINRIPVVKDRKYFGMIFPPVLANAALEVAVGEKQNVTAEELAQPKHCHTVSINTPVKDLVSNKHCGHLAVLDGESYVGMVASKPEMPTEKQKVILVDHNEKVQIIDGIEEAEIIENIDHHRINLTTDNPIFIHYEPVGCTCTIVANFFLDHKIEIPQHIAGVLLSAIISDTVLFRSPTCTEKDIATAKILADLAKVDLEKYGMEMLKAGADVSDLTDEQIVRTDMKEFSAGDRLVSIAQISLMDTAEVLANKANLVKALEALRQEKGYEASYLMVTNILAESTDLIFAGDAEETVRKGFKQEPVDNSVFLAKTMSRKKQIVPPILDAMK